MARQDLQLRQESKRLMMANESIPKVVFKMAIPTIVAFIISSIYSLTDTYFVSALGTNATAAVSVNSSLDQLILMTGSLFAVGANSYIARLLGGNQDKKASQVLSTAFFLAFSLGTLMLLAGVIFMTPMVRLLGATPTCEQYSIDYATYMLYAAPFMASNFVMNQCLRSEGSAMFSMFGMGFGGILNCILDPIFIFTLDMGVAGASLATAISKLVSFVILIFPYLTRRSLLRLSIFNFRLDWRMIGKIVSIGSSSMFRSCLAVLAGILLNDLAGDISDSVLAGIGVANKIMMFPFSIVLGLGTGFQPVAGFNWGAKRFDRVRKSFRFTSAVAIIGGAALALLLAIFSDPVIVLFAGTDPEMRRVGGLCLILQCVALPIHAWVAVVNMLCAGLGNAFGAVLLSTSRQGSCMIPFVHLLSYCFGAYGVASVQAVADVLTLTLAIPMAVYMIRKIRKTEDLYQTSPELFEQTAMTTE